MFSIFQKSIKKEIAELSKQILNNIGQITKLHIQANSCGINDGIEIIMEYLNENEFGLAYEHLKYVISETEIKLTNDQVEKMDLIEKKLGKNLR